MRHEDFEYESRDDELLKIIDRWLTETELIITGEIDGNMEVRIGKSALEDCKAIQEIRIPEGVTKIGSCAFANSVTLIVAPGSYEEKYAKQNGREYELKEV